MLSRFELRIRVIVSLALLTSCATTGTPGTATSPGRSSAHDAPGNRADSEAIAQARADSARYPYTSADIRFMSAMIAHHAQAVRMSALAPARARSGSVKTLAERIIASQEDEITLIEQWLRDRGQRVQHDMTTHTGAHDMAMPGMLTEAQLTQLAQASGPAFDTLFLTFMIQHHQGSATMVKELFATDGAAQDETVFRFASDVNVDQITEIARMEKMLADLTLTQP